MGDSVLKEENELKELIEKIAEEKDYKDAKIAIKAISSGGANYSSELFVATITANHKEDLKLFAKVAFPKEELRKSAELANIYKLEQVFYSRLSDTFEKLYNKYNVPEEDRLYLIKYYGHETTEGKETMVLENLVAKGFGDFDRMKTFDWGYASAAISELAKFHSLGVACIKYKLEDLAKLETIYVAENNILVTLYKDQAIKMGTQVVKEEYRDKMKVFVEKNGFQKETNLLFIENKDGFFTHGDYRPSNLMHRNVNGKLQVVPLDYQTCHMGSFVVDLMYFIWSGSDSEFREKFYKRALEYYYAELTRSLKNLHIDIEEVYPRKVYDQELEEAKYLGLFLGLTLTLLVTVDRDDAPQMETVEDMMPKPSKIGLDRMNGAVADYIKWGYL